MSQGSTASDRESAVRCVMCPTCTAPRGKRYRLLNDSGIPTVTHRRRIDQFYTDMGNHMAEKMELADAQRKG